MAKGCKQPTLCWDCARAIGGSDGCSWSRWFEPVKGWVAERTVLHADAKHHTDSYVVHECPQFVRDAWNGGARRLEEGNRWESSTESDQD